MNVAGIVLLVIFGSVAFVFYFDMLVSYVDDVLGGRSPSPLHAWRSLCLRTWLLLPDRWRALWPGQ